MGRWTLSNIHHKYTALEQDSALRGFPEFTENFGHSVKLTFRLRYWPGGRFVETPKLEWNERIYMIDHDKGTRWEFSANMHRQKPLSPTLEIWVKRYLVAYDTAYGIPRIEKGAATLLDQRLLGVKGPALTRRRETNREQKANAVRRYLEKHGGYLQIEVHHIPSIKKPRADDNAMDKERLLIFDCGVKNGGRRFTAMQYLKVHGQDSNNWERTFTTALDSTRLADFHRATKHRGLVSVPAIVSKQDPPCLAPGECW